jgi:hypothetical protein
MRAGALAVLALPLLLLVGVVTSTGFAALLVLLIVCGLPWSVLALVAALSDAPTFVVLLLAVPATALNVALVTGAVRLWGRWVDTSHGWRSLALQPKDRRGRPPVR